MERHILNFRLDIRNKTGKREEKGLHSISLILACVSKKNPVKCFQQPQDAFEKKILVDLSQLLKNYYVALLYNGNLQLGRKIYRVSLFFLLHRYTHTE